MAETNSVLQASIPSFNSQMARLLSGTSANAFRAVLSFGSVALVGLLTVLSQTIRAGQIELVNVLKTE